VAPGLADAGYRTKAVGETACFKAKNLTVLSPKCSTRLPKGTESQSRFGSDRM